MATRRDVTLGLGAGLAIAAAPAFAQSTATTAAPARVLSQGALDAAIMPEGVPHQIIHLWRSAPGRPRRMPIEEVVERSHPPALRDRFVRHVIRPRLVVFRPQRPNGSAMLLTPGGGYQWVVLDKEGYESALRLNEAGVTVFVLAYRLPNDGWAAGPDVSLQDSQRAMRIIRSRAREFGIDPQRVGVIGFSAGGHVAGMLTLRWDANVYRPAEAADRLSAKPDFSVLMYPVATMSTPFAHPGSRTAMLGATPAPDAERRFSLENMARSDAPPTFLLAAADDNSVPIENTLQLYAALRAQHVPAELHVFEAGGHGFGIRFAVGKPTSQWPDLVLAWMRSRHYLGA